MAQVAPRTQISNGDDSPKTRATSRRPSQTVGTSSATNASPARRLPLVQSRSGTGSRAARPMARRHQRGLARPMAILSVSARATATRLKRIPSRSRSGVTKFP